MKCGKKTYQGPTPTTRNGIERCEDCGNADPEAFKRKVIWYAKPSPQSTSYCFDPEPHFQYFNEFKKRPEGKGDITPVMSLQGSFFMLTRQKYWELNICDEEMFGSWGSQGIEVACKTWLTGGQVMCVQTTWYAHMFRTQGGDFSFPYEQKQSDVNHAKRKARQMFFESTFPGQVHPISWLVEKFWPVHGWTEDDLRHLKSVENYEPTKGILYFTDNQLPIKTARKVQDRIREIAEDTGMELVSSTRKPMDRMGKNVVTDAPRGYHTMFTQILKGLEAMTSDIVFMAEHDVVYSKAHFTELTPEERGKYYYDLTWWKVHPDGRAFNWEAAQVSGLCAYRSTLIAHYEQVLANFDPKNRHFEPGGKTDRVFWRATVPHIDLRTGRNLTKEKYSLGDFRDKSTGKNFTESTIDELKEAYPYLVQGVFDE
jgi:hypothetical protein